MGSHGWPCWLIRDAVTAGRLVVVLEGEAAHAFESHALWLQTPHLPLRARLAIDALAATLPSRVAVSSVCWPDPEKDLGWRVAQSWPERHGALREGGYVGSHGVGGEAMTIRTGGTTDPNRD